MDKCEKCHHNPVWHYNETVRQRGNGEYPNYEHMPPVFYEDNRG
jgi:hypothetical protein